MIAELDGVDDLSLTTNGVLLDRFAGPLVDAGLRRLNVSLDSLSHVRFAEITRRDALDRVLAGLAEAERYPQLRPIKVNCVAIRGFTEEEVPAWQSSRAASPTSSGSSSSCRSTPTSAGTRTTCSPGRRSGR